MAQGSTAVTPRSLLQCKGHRKLPTLCALGRKEQLPLQAGRSCEARCLPQVFAPFLGKNPHNCRKLNAENKEDR